MSATVFKVSDAQFRVLRNVSLGRPFHAGFRLSGRGSGGASISRKSLVDLDLIDNIDGGGDHLTETGRHLLKILKRAEYVEALGGRRSKAELEKRDAEERRHAN